MKMIIIKLFMMTAHTISQRLRMLKKIPAELVPLGSFLFFLFLVSHPENITNGWFMANKGVVLRLVVHSVLLTFSHSYKCMLLVLPSVQLFGAWGIHWSAISLCACGNPISTNRISLRIFRSEQNISERDRMGDLVAGMGYFVAILQSAPFTTT